MISEYKKHYLVIVIITAIISIIQVYASDAPLTVLTFAYPFFSQILSPLVITAILGLIFWYTGNKPTPQTIYKTFLISWIIVILINSYLLYSTPHHMY
ncbi:MAG: hypothetical protein ACK4ND_10125 [Cytophagaceae bacterium]